MWEIMSTAAPDIATSLCITSIMARAASLPPDSGPANIPMGSKIICLGAKSSMASVNLLTLSMLTVKLFKNLSYFTNGMSSARLIIMLLSIVSAWVSRRFNSFNIHPSIAYILRSVSSPIMNKVFPGVMHSKSKKPVPNARQTASYNLSVVLPTPPIAEVNVMSQLDQSLKI